MPKRARDAGTAMVEVVAKLVDQGIVKDEEIKQLRARLGTAPIAAAAETFVRHEVKARYAAYARKIDALGDRVRSLETENTQQKSIIEYLVKKKRELESGVDWLKRVQTTKPT